MPENGTLSLVLGASTAVGLAIVALVARRQGSVATLPTFLAWMAWSLVAAVFLWQLTGQRLPLIGVGAVALLMGLFGYWYVRRIGR